MRTELEFSIKLIVDPNEPVSAQEARAMLGMYEVLRSLQPGPTPQTQALATLVAETTPPQRLRDARGSKARNMIWRQRKVQAQVALQAAEGDELLAARSLNLAFGDFYRWLNGPADPVSRTKAKA